MAGSARLSELCEAIVDCPHSTPKWTDTGVIVLRNQNIRHGRLDLSKPSYTDEQHFAERTRRARPRAGDLVITREAPMGEVCMIPSDLRCCLGQRMVLLRPNRARAVPRYLLYALQSKPVQHEIAVNEGTGSTVSNLRIPSLEALPIPCRPLPEQRMIGHILGTLDDKIEVNRRLNETLEATVRTIFKSWFVEFEPVHARAEGRNPGLPTVADFFPDSFEDSDLGRIPKGWRASKIGAEVETVLGGTPSRTEPGYWGGDIPWINSSKANEFRVVEPTEMITKEGLDNSAARMLPPRTTVIAITGATLGQVSLTEIATCANQSIIGVIGNATLPNEFLYLWVKSRIEELLTWQTGGAQQHINKRNVDDSRVLVPSKPIMQAFMAQVLPFFDRIKASCLESRALSALRDTMLHRLTTGEVRISISQGSVGSIS